MKIWQCKIGESVSVPNGADAPMREAVARAYKELTGEEPTFIFSGWGAELTEPERAVVEDRLPAQPAASAEPSESVVLLDALSGLVKALRERHHGRMPDEVQAAYDKAWAIVFSSPVAAPVAQEQVGYGVFWREGGQRCSVLKSSEDEALSAAVNMRIPGASIEPVFRRAAPVAQEPVAYIRRWAFDGVKPEKVRNENGRLVWSFKHKLRDVTKGKCLDDDVPLYAAPVAAQAQQPVSGADESPKNAALFTKKPVTISAIRWTGENLRDVIEFTGKHPRWGEWFASWEDYERHVREDGQRFKIFTLEGTMVADPDDWIIRGVKGEYYPCKPDIFAATYDAAQQPSAQDREDAERYRWATALDDNSETLHSIVLSYGGDQAKINERVDVYRACDARAAKEQP
ncbi:MAG: hypothetical protein KUL86_06845 [Castellaniella sp.]|nr:hypothetical protein [Castellaniella sp.]